MIQNQANIDYHFDVVRENREGLEVKKNSLKFNNKSEWKDILLEDKN